MNDVLARGEADGGIGAEVQDYVELLCKSSADCGA